MRFVFKIGTSLLAYAQHKLDRAFLRGFVSQVAAIHKKGHEIILVSSGAVAAGRSVLSFDGEKKDIPFRQALAAAGQGMLMNNYHEFFGKYGITVAQALLTNYDFMNHENSMNTKHVLELLLKYRAIPIVNENDVTTIAELKFGDNDILSAKTASLTSADLLVIFTDVDGLCMEDPKKNPCAKIVPCVKKIDHHIKILAHGSSSERTLGGMKTKIEAAEYVTRHGIPMVIANGKRDQIVRHVIDFFLQEEKPEDFQLGTHFRAR